MSFKLVGLLGCAIIVPTVIGDSLDWINPSYPPSSDSRVTGAAQKFIITGAGKKAMGGPWSVINSTVLPPSGNKHDYLSWAPYHWPSCHWCSNKQKRSLTEKDTNILDPGPVYFVDAEPGNAVPQIGPPDIAPLVPSVTELIAQPTHIVPFVPKLPQDAAPTDGNQIAAAKPSSSNTGSSKPSKTTKSASTDCTPSPTRAIAPSATWTMCPYVSKDGQRNPDVDTIPDSADFSDMSLAVLYNALAFSLTKTPSYANAAVSFIDTWFLNRVTAMAPNIQYGQLIRGPSIPNQPPQGQHMGISDLRGMVSVMNALQIFTHSNSSLWDDVRDHKMLLWVSQYTQWLLTSPIGQKAGTSPNNHGTFWMCQIVATKIYLGDIDGARKTILYFLSHQFMDQIAASGEQPFEATRSRPFHYRCYNIEALITLAKLGDQLGINVWRAESRYHSTLQDAIDYMMSSISDEEPVAPALPHVATAAVVYGDPKGKYSKFIKDNDESYARRAWFFYDQPGAFGSSSSLRPPQFTAPTNSRRESSPTDNNAESSNSNSTNAEPAANLADAIFSTPVDARGWSAGDPPIRPNTFGDQGVDPILLDDGVLVTWPDVKPYYLVVRTAESEDKLTSNNASISAAPSNTPSSRSTWRRQTSNGPARVMKWQ